MTAEQKPPAPLDLGAKRSGTSLEDFHKQQAKDREDQISQELQKLLETVSPQKSVEYKKEFEGFERLFSQFLRESGTPIEWSKIKPLGDGGIITYDKLPEPSGTEDLQKLLSQLAVVKLNGGLGTSMGCTGPKSIIQVRNDQTFLDLNVKQIEHFNETYDVDIPLILMNSFNTDEDTQKILRKYRGRRANIQSFMQSRYPRIDRESLMPIAKTLMGSPLEAWYPPGHGDFYQAVYDSGVLDRLIADGKKYIFMSNIDNLGATVDVRILNFLLKSDHSPEFIMEVTDKTRADVKGGTLITYMDNLRLLEIAQVPKQYVEEFKSISKFKIFNTNNLWMSTEAIKRIMDAKAMKMEVIVNPKSLDNGRNVIQLEVACGDAIRNFERAVGVNVPRSRFLPVKKSSDLLLVMSNLYKIENGTLIMNPDRNFLSTPLVKLGTHFDKVNDFQRRFSSIPDIAELDHLTVSGDVTFGKGVALKGTVIIIANHGDRIDIPTGALLENKIVSGNLRILDH